MAGTLRQTPRPPARFFANYELLGLLGRGGMSEVYRARIHSGPGAGTEVALKRLLPALVEDPASVALFAREAELTPQLDHPNIVKVLEVGLYEGEYFIAMERVDGRDLGQILRRCKGRGIPLPQDFALFLARTLLDALGYAHAWGERGVIHCDVSPSNLFISRLGEVKLGDFGVARVRPAADERGEVLGKPYYLSPEAIEGEISQAGDLWAATVMLYELLTLERPFVGNTPGEVFDAIRDRHYRPLRERRPELPPALEGVVARGFAFEREERFPDAQAMARALAPHFDERVGTPLAIAAVVRGLFGTSDPT